MKYCVYCGAEMLDDAIMCPKCGRMVDGYYANRLLKRKASENDTTVVNGILDDDGNIIPIDEDINKVRPSANDVNPDGNTSMDLYAKLAFAFSFFIPFLGAGFAISAIYARDKTSADGRRMAIAGLVISIIGFILGILINILVLNQA